MKTKTSILLGVALSLLVTLGSTSNAADLTASLNPRSTFILTSNDPGIVDPLIIDLGANGFAPGQELLIEGIGEFSFRGWPSSGDEVNWTIGVFSATDVLLGSNQPHRVPDAIDAGTDFDTGSTYYGGYSTDIPEDFAVALFNFQFNSGFTSTTVTVPPGANYLFISAWDSFYGDNVDYDGDYGVDIAILNMPPVANCGDDVTVEAVDAFGASVQLDGTASYDPDGDALEFEWAVPDGSGAVLDDSTRATPTGLFPIGRTLVTLTVTDGNGGIDFCDILVTVQDTTPPVLVCTTDIIALWPPNHGMEPVQVTIIVTDASSPEDLALLCYVTSSEPDDGTGDGSSIGDVDGDDGYATPVPVELTYDGANFVATVDLRAERDGSEKGRDYSIVCEVVDASGNSATASCVVVVPHDKRKK